MAKFKSSNASRAEIDKVVADFTKTAEWKSFAKSVGDVHEAAQAQSK